MRARTSGDWPAGFRRRLRSAVERTGLVVATALAVSLATAGIALLTPGTLPLRTSTGLLVGIFSWIAGIVLASFVSGSSSNDGHGPPPSEQLPPVHPPDDVRVRPAQRRRARYIRTAAGARRHGADRSVRLRGDRRTGAREFVKFLDRHARDGALLRLGLAPIDRHPAGWGWGDGIAEQLARRGRRILLVDLREAADRRAPGVTDVARGQSDIAAAVTFHETLKLARLGPGSDPRSAAVELGVVLDRLPRDVEAVVVCLPPLGAAAVPAVAQIVDHLAFVAVRDHTQLDGVRRAADVAGADVEVMVALVDAEAGPGAPSQDMESGEPAWPATGVGPTAAPGDQAPTRSEVWGREIAHASEELEATLDPDAVDADAIWVAEADGHGLHTGVDEVVADLSGERAVDAAGIWEVDDPDPSRSMSSSAHPRDPHG
jgi:hypothetical protein